MIVDLLTIVYFLRIVLRLLPFFLLSRQPQSVKFVVLKMYRAPATVHGTLAGRDQHYAGLQRKFLATCTG